MKSCASEEGTATDAAEVEPQGKPSLPEQHSAIVLQLIQRGHVARMAAAAERTRQADEAARRRAAAGVIQNQARAKVARLTLARLKADAADREARRRAATELQCHACGRQARTRYARARAGATTIQAHQRGHVARCEANAQRVRRDAEVTRMEYPPRNHRHACSRRHTG
jgi:hypothetical protein